MWANRDADTWRSSPLRPGRWRQSRSRTTSRPHRPGPRCDRLSERIVDAGEDRRPFRAVAHVDEAHDLRPHYAADAEAAHGVEVGDGRVGDTVEYLAALEERRQLDFQVDAEDLVLPDARAQLGARQRAVEVDEALRPVAAQGPPA